MQELSTGHGSLITGPMDDIHYAGFCRWERCFGKPESSHIYVVAHRGLVTEMNVPLSVWTHVYRVVEDSLTGRPVVYLEAVLTGDSVVRGLAKAYQLVATFGEPA
jgi:hypothetical protein